MASSSSSSHSAQPRNEDELDAGEEKPLVPGKHGKRGTLFQCGICEWLLPSTLAQVFGHRLLIMLVASQHLMKGFASSFTSPAVQFIYASYGVSGPQMQVFGGVTQLPWAMKPVIGLVSDCFPVGGYHKAPYIFLASVFGSFACGSIGLTNNETLEISALVACLFLVQLQFSTCDLLTEAKYAEKMRVSPEHGPALMTFVWFGLQVGGLLGTALAGPTIKHFSAQMPFLLALIPASLILLPLSQNFLEEVPRCANEAAAARHRLLEQREACFLCVLMFAGTIVLTLLGIFYESVEVNAVAALTVAVVMLVSFSIALRPIIAKVNAFFLVQSSLGFSIGGAAFYFFTDSPSQYPEGPHFSIEFFTSVLGVVGAICSLIGIYSYQRFVSDWTYRRLILMTNVALSALSFADVVLFARWNVRFGFPDAGFVLGASVLTAVISQWMWMPGVVILSQLCPSGMEATMYALLAGCHNLGNTIASSCGAIVLKWLKCQPAGHPGESAQFENLWLASLLSTVLPMFTLLLIPWLIPNARQTDKLLDDDDRSLTSGSIWRRWTRR